MSNTTTKQRTRKPKIDFSQWTKEEKIEPKTLAECHAEAGGFPFSVKALSDHPEYSLNSPKGTERTYIGTHDELGGFVGLHHPYTCTQNNILVVADKSLYARWQLLGHK